MKRLLILILLALPLRVMAQMPAIQELGKEAQKQKDIRYISVNNVMLGMAATFAPKEQRATFKMLKNIDLIECRNNNYAPQLTQQALNIAKQTGTKHIGTQDDGLARNEVYALQKGDTIVELLILSYGHNGGVALTAMSGEIPISRLEEISKIKPE